MITGKTKLYGLLATPIGHSLSPLIQNQLFEEMRIDGIYVPFETPIESLMKVYEGVKALKVQGMNVSLPHKEAIIPLLDDVDEMALMIGAVNTLKWTDNGYKGYNTDKYGLTRTILEEGFAIADQEIIIIGAGGTARTATMMAIEEGAKKIYIINRTKERADELALAGNLVAGKEIAISLAMDELYKIEGYGERARYLCIQTTNVGMYPRIEESPVCEEAFFKSLIGVVDIIFNPTTTQFMSKARQANVKAVNGLKMLVYQGVRSFEIWNDVQIEEELAKQVLGKAAKVLS